MSKTTKKTKPAKRAAKKAPAPKLIEGKYSHKFLTRLEPDAGKVLEEYLKRSNIKTFNGAVRYMVLNMARVELELQQTREQLQVARVNVKQYQDAIGRYTGAFEGLSKVKPLTKVQTSIFDPDDEDDNCPACGEQLSGGHCENPDCEG